MQPKRITFSVQRNFGQKQTAEQWGAIAINRASQQSITNNNIRQKVKAEAEKTKAEAERLKAEAERMKQEAEKLKKNTENSVPATKLVPATKKENTTGTSEGAGWVVPTMTEEVEEKKVEKTAEGVVLKEDPKYRTERLRAG